MGEGVVGWGCLGQDMLCSSPPQFGATRNGRYGCVIGRWCRVAGGVPLGLLISYRDPEAWLALPQTTLAWILKLNRLFNQTQSELVLSLGGSLVVYSCTPAVSAFSLFPHLCWMRCMSSDLDAENSILSAAALLGLLFRPF